MNVVSLEIICEGKTLPAQFSILSVAVSREVNRIPRAELVLLDGDAARQQFELSDQAFFEPGNKVEIQARYEGSGGQNETLFIGQVIRHHLEANAQDSTLTVELQDTVLGMTKRRNSAVFRNKTDAEVIKTLLSNNGIAAGSIPPSSLTQEELVQYYCSDWDFMLSRAEANNLLVVVEDGKVALKKIELSGIAKYTFEYGLDLIYSFEMEADASAQYTNVETVSWDIKTQQLASKSTAADFALSQGNLDGNKIAHSFSGATKTLNSTVQLSPEETQAWADAEMARTRMSFMKGVIAIPGIAKVQLLDLMEIKGISQRFNGSTLITGIRHSINEDGWQSHLQFGLPAAPFAQSSHILDAPAAGLLPGVQGLQVGLVDAFEEDEQQKEFRVRVLLPGINTERNQVWARLASPDAGQGRGYFFRPEKGDEVVVGFFNDDPRQAVILGAMYSSKNVPPSDWGNVDEQNNLKGIVSRTGISLSINDEDQTLTFSTSEDQSIVLDEKNKRIEIVDAHQNTITLDQQGIHIKTNDKLMIESAGDLELKGRNINLEASGNVAIKGSQVDIK